MKFFIAIVVILGAFFFMWKSNNADKERLAQAEITHQQKLELEKTQEISQNMLGEGVDPETVKKAVAVKLDKTNDPQPEQAQQLKDLINEWNDAVKVAGATSRIAVSQPVATMQEIKRKLSSAKYGGCIETTRLFYEDAMAKNIDGYLTFMLGKDHELKAMVLFHDYEKQIELAKSEQSKCSALNQQTN